MITKERKNEIIGLSWDETNEEWTQEWRHYLTGEEEIFVKWLDRQHDAMFYRLRKGILAAHKKAAAPGAGL